MSRSGLGTHPECVGTARCHLSLDRQEHVQHHRDVGGGGDSLGAPFSPGGQAEIVGRYVQRACDAAKERRSATQNARGAGARYGDGGGQLHPPGIRHKLTISDDTHTTTAEHLQCTRHDYIPYAHRNHNDLCMEAFQLH